MTHPFTCIVPIASDWQLAKKGKTSLIVIIFTIINICTMTQFYKRFIEAEATQFENIRV